MNYCSVDADNREDSGTNIGCKMVTEESLRGLMNAVWCMISGGELVQWVAIKGPSEVTPSD